MQQVSNRSSGEVFVLDDARALARSAVGIFVISALKQKEKGITAMDIAKRLLDFGFHPPTVYFPLIVDESLMIEPSETESRETLDEFASAMEQVAAEAEHSPELLKEAPHNLCVSRLDEVRAAKDLNLRWVEGQQQG